MILKRKTIGRPTNKSHFFNSKLIQIEVSCVYSTYQRMMINLKKSVVSVFKVSGYFRTPTMHGIICFAPFGSIVSIWLTVQWNPVLY